ncbi:MAG: nitrate reductase associated protein [Ginsengibacter sp.]
MKNIDLIYIPEKKSDKIFFDFEEDFIEKNIKCVPMIVRFKLDACDIKLKLSEWTRMTIVERDLLIDTTCATKLESKKYHSMVQEIVSKSTGHEAKILFIDNKPAWADIKKVSDKVNEKAKEFGWQINVLEWKHLSNLQRFALLKLCRPGHENKNFPIAMKEFELVS